MSKSVSSTVVAPFVSEMPPLCLILPANDFASISATGDRERQRAVGFAEAGSTGAAVIPRLVSADAAPGSRVSLVSPPVVRTDSA